jgi:hypothetical protein
MGSWFGSVCGREIVCVLKCVCVGTLPVESVRVGALQCSSADYPPQLVQEGAIGSSLRYYTVKAHLVCWPVCICAG